MITHYFKKRHKGTGVVQGLLAVVMAVGAVDVVAETRIMNEESLVSTQHLVTPMLSLAEAPKHDRKPMAELRIEGQIEAPGYVIIDLQTLQAMNAHSLSTSTVVTDGVLRFDGVLMREVLAYVGAYGSMVTATALNGYEVDIPVRDFLDFDVLLAWAVDGKPLRSDDKGPFWIVYPRDQHDVLQDIRYDYRWVWQLNSLRVH